MIAISTNRLATFNGSRSVNCGPTRKAVIAKDAAAMYETVVYIRSRVKRISLRSSLIAFIMSLAFVSIVKLT